MLFPQHQSTNVAAGSGPATAATGHRCGQPGDPAIRVGRGHTTCTVIALEVSFAALTAIPQCPG
jgi:hypothetical protein